MVQAELVVFCSSDLFFDQVRRGCGTSWILARVSRWEDVAAAASSASCALVASEEGDRWLLRGILDIRAKSPDLAFLVVGEAGPLHALRQLNDPLIEGIREQDAQHRIPTLLTQLRWRSLFRWMARLIEGNAKAPVGLRRALAICCLSALPITSVTSLARAAQSHRSTLTKQWKQTFGAPPMLPLRLEDFVAMVILLRALAAKVPSITWREVSSGLGVHERTLRRTAHRLFGTSLGSLASQHPQVLSIRVRSLALRVLV